MVHQREHQYHHPPGDAHRIAGELLNHGYSQARHELSAEFMHNPREAQRLLHQIGGELRQHGYRGIGVELDRHHNITHVDFNHHNIYSGLGHGDYHPYIGHHHRQDAGHGQVHGRGRHHQQEESFAPPSQRRNEREAQPQRQPENPNEVRNPFVDMSNAIEHKLDQAGHVIGDGLKKVGDGIGDAARELGHDFDKLSREAGQKMAHLAASVAARLGTTGDCAHGPRLVFDKLGIHLPPMMATAQGRAIRNSGMFEEIPEKDVRPGDYGVRNWSNHVIRQHGYNAGDSFIVLSNHNGNIVQANDHVQSFDRRHRYADAHFYRLKDDAMKKLLDKGFV